MRAPRVFLLATLALLLTLLVGSAGTSPHAAAESVPGKPMQLVVSVPQGERSFRLTWAHPAGLDLPSLTGYEVSRGGVVVATTDQTSVVITNGLHLGRRYTFSVRARTTGGVGKSASSSSVLYVNPVTTVQEPNPSNPLAGREWGVYQGASDPAWSGWSKLDQGAQDKLALIAMTSKAKFFGSWIPDGAAYSKTRQYIKATQAGDPERLTFLTLFRMDPWEGAIRTSLPTRAQRRSYKTYVRATARAIDTNPVAVVVQPDGYFAKIAFDAHRKKKGTRKALMPARMLRWTVRTLGALPQTSVYLEMGSEDWARGNVGAVAKFLRLSGVAFARGFALNVSHKNYLDREIMFSEAVAKSLAKQGIPNMHAVLDTSDNGHPFSGAELNTKGAYTAPGDVRPCKSAAQTSICTALGVPPTTDVDNPSWGLSARAARTAAEYVDAYLWVSRPWLPHQGAGGTGFSPRYARKLLKTNPFTPFFHGTA